MSAAPLMRRAALHPAASLLRRSDLDALSWVAEQYAVRTDQLARLLGCSERSMQRTLARLREAELARVQRVLVDEPGWVLPTAKGLRACGSPFGVWRPKLGLLAHTAAVNEVRLQIQASAPRSVWVCERTLARECKAGGHLPDGVVEMDGQRVAVEVELTVKSRRRVAAILDQLAGRFDATVYYCTPATRRLLAELADGGRWPALAFASRRSLGSARQASATRQRCDKLFS